MMSVSQINEEKDGTKVQTTLEVTKMYPPRTVTTKYGERDVMDIMAQDGTGQIKIAWWAPTVTEGLEGQIIFIGGKATVRRSTYQGTERVEISVSKTDLYGGEPAGAPEGSPAPSADSVSGGVSSKDTVATEKKQDSPSGNGVLVPNKKVTDTEMLSACRRWAAAFSDIYGAESTEEIAKAVTAFIIAVGDRKMVIDEAALAGFGVPEIGDDQGGNDCPMPDVDFPDDDDVPV